MLDEIIQDLASFAHDPLGWVMWAFPWGEPGTDLEHSFGPEKWQATILSLLGKGLISPEGAIRLAVTSGHGVGKSALVAWIILWAISTCPDTRGVVTANTETQLKTKTWVELATWYRRFIAREMFKLTATAIFSTDPERERTWRIDMVPWSERNTEAFAGLHNKGRRILLVMDEASAIPDLIHEVAEGALTDEGTEIIWCMFGNPTRNKGRFRDAFPGGRFAHRWKTLRVDSRTVSFTNKAQIAEWEADYGADSDFFRVRAKGEFPRVDAESFIPLILATLAVGRVVIPQAGVPLLLGVDVGRFGDDPSVIYPRRGRDASSLPIELMFGLNTMQTAARVAETFSKLGADMALVDGGGVGGGVVDRLHQLRIPTIEVQFGAKADNTNIIERGIKYANKRAEIWGGVKDWLPFGSIPDFKIPQPNGDIVTLAEELSNPQYGLTDKEEIRLERKKDMRARGVPSPNVADALACTFAVPTLQPRGMVVTAPTVEPPYDPYDLKRIYANVAEGAQSREAQDPHRGRLGLLHYAQRVRRAAERARVARVRWGLAA